MVTTAKVWHGIFALRSVFTTVASPTVLCLLVCVTRLQFRQVGELPRGTPAPEWPSEVWPCSGAAKGSARAPPLDAVAFPPASLLPDSSSRLLRPRTPSTRGHRLD
uniref:Putative secreted protein n=1 Tax=Ixodes ricinus TaxID=34613 RepID=A0A6B0UGE4_IXORI